MRNCISRAVFSLGLIAVENNGLWIYLAWKSTELTLVKSKSEDPRKTGLKNGLRQLTIAQLQRVINYSEEMVLDTYNYEDGKFCALAIALQLDKTMIDPSHDKVFTELTKQGYKVYNTRGIEGKFYTTNRKEDLLEAALEVLKEKEETE